MKLKLLLFFFFSISIAFPQKVEISVTSEDDLAKVFGISNIHFDFNKLNINTVVEQNLVKFIVLMNEYPTMKIAICSHTDT